MATLIFGGTSMISNEYELAWLLYGLAAVGCFWVWTFFTRWMWRYLRELLWLAMAVLLCSPTPVSPDDSALVPSVIKLAMDLVFKVNNDAWRALADLTLYGSLALAAYAVFAVVRFLVEQYWLKPRRRARAEQAAQAEQAELQASPATDYLSAVADLRREPTLG